MSNIALIEFVCIYNRMYLYACICIYLLLYLSPLSSLYLIRMLREGMNTLFARHLPNLQNKHINSFIWKIRWISPLNIY